MTLKAPTRNTPKPEKSTEARQVNNAPPKTKSSSATSKPAPNAAVKAPEERQVKAKKTARPPERPLPASQPKQTEFITVHPGDFDTRFLRLTAETGVLNRPLILSNLSWLTQTWNPEQAQVGQLTLVRREDGLYFILDGQHRIKTVSDSVSAFMFTALIHGPEMLTDPARMALIVRTINSSRPMNTTDRLRVASERSDFVRILREHGTEPHFNHSGKYRWEMITLLRGLHFFESSLADGTPRASMPRQAAASLELRFTETSTERVTQIARILRDWEAVATVAKVRANVPLYTAYSAAAALLLEDRIPGVLGTLAERMNSYDPNRLGALKFQLGRQNSAGFRSFLEQLLNILNHRRQEKNYDSIFGLTGR